MINNYVVSRKTFVNLCRGESQCCLFAKAISCMLYFPFWESLGVLVLLDLIIFSYFFLNNGDKKYMTSPDDRLSGNGGEFALCCFVCYTNQIKLYCFTYNAAVKIAPKYIGIYVMLRQYIYEIQKEEKTGSTHFIYLLFKSCILQICLL